MSCRKASYIIEKGEVSQISLWERMNLKFHLMICKLCRKYQSDSRILGRLMKKLATHEHSGHLTEEEKAEIRKRLAER
jgi:hypothetical protein